MTVNSISKVGPVDATQTAKNAPRSKPPQKPAQDSVQLSPAALAALNGAGDADHDGDSH
jgi:hypothetical protein